jgi:hypothetical protein
MEQAIPSTVKKALIVRVSPSINLPLGAWYAGHIRLEGPRVVR